jgi:HPt (histidine-containing phosphotransfer) domain-containing protein
MESDRSRKDSGHCNKIYEGSKIEPLFQYLIYAVRSIIKNIRINDGRKDVENYEEVIHSFMTETGFDREDAEEILKEGIEMFSEMILEIEQDIKSENQSEALKKLHRLKGAAGNLRIKDVAHRAVLLEDLQKNGDSTDTWDVLDEIKEILDDLTNSLF